MMSNGLAVVNTSVVAVCGTPADAEGTNFLRGSTAERFSQSPRHGNSSERSFNVYRLWCEVECRPFIVKDETEPS